MTTDSYGGLSTRYVFHNLSTWFPTLNHKDEYGNIILDTTVGHFLYSLTGLGDIAPNYRGDFEAEWNGTDKSLTGTSNMYWIWTSAVGGELNSSYAYSTDLKNFQATLRTIQLIKAD